MKKIISSVLFITAVAAFAFGQATESKQTALEPVTQQVAVEQATQKDADPLSALSPEEKKEEIIKIEQELQVSETKQKQLSADVADKERAIRTVQKDYSSGHLSSADRDMLLEMFSKKLESAKQQLTSIKNQITALLGKKQKLLTDQS